MDKKIVLPGEELSTAEEFEEGENTFTEEDSVYSDSIGKVEFDSKNYEVSVKKKKNVKLFSPGTKIYGLVTGIRKSSVSIKILEAYDGIEPRVFTRSRASIMVSVISRDYVKDIRAEFKIGDIVVAEVEDVKPYGVNLRTDKPELGVLRAYCTKCRKPLHLSHGKLMCTSCGSLEHRKLSNEYSLK